jgi:hypothetical protein
MRGWHLTEAFFFASHEAPGCAKGAEAADFEAQADRSCRLFQDASSNDKKFFGGGEDARAKAEAFVQSLQPLFCWRHRPAGENG